MPTNSLLLRLVEVYRGENLRHPHLRAVTLAQWMLESASHVFAWLLTPLCRRVWHQDGRNFCLLTAV